MSLVKQLWISTALLMLLAFGGSFVVSSLSAKAYLEEQLLLKNIDNATSLASTLSQMPKDEVSVELLVAAQFDSGHYRYIRITDPQGTALIDLNQVDDSVGAPDWFMRLFPIRVEPGIAQVQDGWSQFGTLELQSHYRYAYASLWDGTVRMLIWFCFAAVLAAVLGTWVLRIILSPLDDVVAQAKALGARRFITIPEPATLEFRTVVRSMNELTRRVKHMLEDESSRLEQLRQEAHQDPVTGLLNRSHFMSRVNATLTAEDASAEGVLVIARLLNLVELNKSQGWSLMDELIKRFGQALGAIHGDGQEWVIGRLNGSDFAVLAPGQRDSAALGHQISEAMSGLARELGVSEPCLLPVGATPYRYQERLPDVLARTDAALASAVDEGGNSVQVIIATGVIPESAVRKQDAAEWKVLLEQALADGKLRIHTYPVQSVSGGLFHSECVARMQVGDSEDWITAGQFMPWLTRLKMSSKLDAAMLELALAYMTDKDGDLCLNVSSQTLQDPASTGQMAERLKQAGELARRIWIEIPEHGVFQNLDNYRALCSALQGTGVKLGIEHVGHEVSRLGLLHDLGIDYIKVDSSFISEIDTNPANQVFLRGLAMIAHSIGMSVVAEGVSSQDELKAIAELGFDGATGPAITL